MSDIDAVQAYRTALRSTYVSRDGDECGRTYDLVDEAAADAAIAALLARVEELSNQREQSHAAFHIQKVRADKAEEVIRTLEMMLADGAGEVTVRRSGDDGFVISDDSEDEEGADGTAP